MFFLYMSILDKFLNLRKKPRKKKDKVIEPRKLLHFRTKITK